MKMLKLLLAVALFGVAVNVVVASDGRGWGDNVNWRPYSEALAEAKAQNKGTMLIIWKSWCGACKNLKPLVAASSEFVELSSNFVMSNVGDDEEPSDSQFAPDGGYIPRILFLDPQGKVDTSIYNKRGSEKYKYYYSDASQILDAMREAAQKFSGAEAEL
eukprot:TRINITY_DN27699_c0_g1_i1.p1 TRINITY_DN27699_c0_g1~~TRINITY_DN27699_c0_g1_i1.p1  ORF type:complete len:170 (-),score=27.25 TRINITY_DN27699_c0_g1_i1:98-577(-)